MKFLISLVAFISIQSVFGDYRLNNADLTVDSYVLKISSIKNETFIGVVTITVKLETDAETIELHAENMTFPGDFKINGANAQFNVTKETNILSLRTGKTIPAGTYTLEVMYTGNIVTDEMYGFYKSSYGDNNENILYATQFEPIYARRLLPCFDEPSYKATFEVTVVHDNTFSVLSNTVGTVTANNDNETSTTKFEITPRMSTYLLALVISEFASTEAESETAVWTSKENLKYTKTAADVTPKLIEELGKFVNLEYANLGIAKSDQVAIPDFAAGAMENWGLITYRESDLLDEADKTTASGKQKVATVICHELAHQWFGDYVTLKWWGETWLNEGFATYFEYHVADLLQDDFDLDKQFVIKVLQPVLLSDSVSTVQALYTPEEEVSSLVQINNKFGDISYYKGGSVLRMVQHYLGLDSFKAVLNSYLNEHHLDNVEHDHLIKAIGNDGEMFRKWFEQAGYPLVTVSLDNTTLTFTQKDYTNPESNQTWSIPIDFQSSDPSVQSNVFWLEASDATVPKLANKVDWIVVNNLQAGYYRVNYDEALWTGLINALNQNESQINELNRAQLIDDAFNLANTGEVSYNTAFNLIKYLKNEDSYYPWYSTFSVITALLKKVENDNVSASIKKEILNSMDHLITIPESPTAPINRTHIETLKTVDILSKACTFGHDACAKFASSVLTAYLKDKNINNDFRAFGLCTAIANSADQKEWDDLWGVLLKSETSHEKDDMLLALACSQNESILATYLNRTIDSSSGIRRQDGKTVLRAIIKNGPNGIKASLDFMQNSGKVLVDYYKGMNALGDLVLNLANVVSSAADIKTVTDYITNNQDVEEVKEVSDQVKKVMSNNEQWWKNNKDVLLELFPEPEPEDDGANSVTITFGLLCVCILFLVNL